MTEAHDLELQQVLNLLQRMQHAFHTLLLGAETECTNADVKIAFGLLAPDIQEIASLQTLAKPSITASTEFFVRPSKPWLPREGMALSQDFSVKLRALGVQLTHSKTAKQQDPV